MTAALVYAASGLAGAVLGAIAGTTGIDRSLVAVVAPLSLLLFVRRRLVVQALAVAATLMTVTCSLASLHAQRASSISVLAQEVPRCELAGSVQERFGSSGAVIAISFRCADGRSGAGRAYAGISAAPGARVEGRGWLVPLDDDGGFTAMRERAGLRAEVHFDDVRVTPPRGISGLAESFRSSLRAALSDDAAGELALGLTIGETTRFSPRDVELLRAAGLSHLVAVSGSNVAIVLAAIGALFVWASRRLRLVAAAAGLTAFVIVVGPEPSVLRAAAMGAVVLAALASGTRGDPLVGLMLAVTILLVLRPTLVWSVGLHLSVAATAGIVLWSRALEEGLATVPQLVRVPLAVTLAAQLAVTPVLLATFGTFSVVAPVSNVLTAPVIAPATILSLVAGCLQPLAPSLAAIPARTSEVLCGWVLAIGRYLGTPGWAELSVGGGWAALLALAPLPVLVTALRKRRRD